ncbi:substrate-binding periplasmic protein [Litorilituus lipolyticus]|uniref:Transporter substrate-binding domain-containing protein n=1 Tax=Litorilituus lipolyticus TaxID=2491017 RepID=A0A502KV70_9GAMM|nr:transporter substrate-binding domain-containing protein [Litorilituus lipolyticus]TPH12137.1 transporter substrate-binding domain-containing protein [Litorilituus lipolyticus]
MNKYLFLLLIAYSGWAQAASKIPINVYVYHMQPPLVINLEDETGLYFEFTRYLNKLTARYHFEVVFLPRKRLDRMLSENRISGVVLGVNPTWFKDKAQTKYLWTAAFMHDRDEIISLNSNPFQYNKPASLEGMVIGGVRGFYYYGINELVKAGKAVRVDTVKELDLFPMLLKRRVDVAIIGRSAYGYMMKETQWHDVFHLSTEPHDSFERRILVTKDRRALHQKLSEIVEKLPNDKLWQQSLLNYQ